MISIFFYLITINVTGFVMMAIDKRRAKKAEWRISERLLMTIAVFGAAFGMIIAGNIFRHKTKKNLFRIGLPILLVIHVLLLFLINEYRVYGISS